MRLPAALVILLTVLALTGCSTADPVVVPAPEPTSTPLFASDEEALAAAEEAYAAYRTVVDQIYADGGANPERLINVATDSVVEHQLPGFAQLLENGNRVVGQATIDSFELQSYDPNAVDGLAVVSVYLCEDFSGTDVLDAAGFSIVTSDRQLRWPLDVSFDATGSSSLLVSNIDAWTGANFCD